MAEQHRSQRGKLETDIVEDMFAVSPCRCIESTKKQSHVIKQVDHVCCVRACCCTTYIFTTEPVRQVASKLSGSAPVQSLCPLSKPPCQTCPHHNAHGSAQPPLRKRRGARLSYDSSEGKLDTHVGSHDALVKKEMDQRCSQERDACASDTQRRS